MCVWLSVESNSWPELVSEGPMNIIGSDSSLAGRPLHNRAASPGGLYAAGQLSSLFMDYLSPVCFTVAFLILQTRNVRPTRLTKDIPTTL